MNAPRNWRESLKSTIRNRLSDANVERAQIITRSLRDLRKTFDVVPPPRYPIAVAELKAAFVELGIGKGDIVHVHSSVSHLMRGATQPPSGSVPGIRSYSKAIIDVLIELVGADGTITMGTDFARPPGWLRRITANQELPGDVFDPATHPSNRGLVSEYFRKRPDVVRSLYPYYNVTAWGRHANELVKDHERSTPYAQDAHSPWYKLTKMGGKVLLLGRTFDINSLVHLVEYLHPDEYPRPLFMSRPVSMGYLNRDGDRRNVDVLLHIAGAPGAGFFAPEALFKFCEYINGKYGVYRIRPFADDVQIVCYDAMAQYDAFHREMKQNVTWYDPDFLG